MTNLLNAGVGVAPPIYTFLLPRAAITINGNLKDIGKSTFLSTRARTNVRNEFVALQRSLKVLASSKSRNCPDPSLGPGPRNYEEKSLLKDDQEEKRWGAARSVPHESGDISRNDAVAQPQALSLAEDEELPERAFRKVGRRNENVSSSERRRVDVDFEEHEDAERGGDSQAEDFRTLVSAMGLIMGTAVGPGILGLPAATLPSGLQASTIMIIGAWAYVTSSILLVAEISCAVMAERGVKEVSFTGLVEHTLGFGGARAAAVVYASLNYALLVACVAGLGSILHGWVPLPAALWSSASAAVVGGIVGFGSFKSLDRVNRALCGLMLAAITSLVAIGVYAGKFMLVNSGATSVFSYSSVLSAVPVTVLTLGFHVITPVICKLLGGRPEEARKAILLGGAVPLAMVLAWNGVILSLAPYTSRALDPIKLLLSLNRSAAPAVQAFAFAALGTTLIGYAVSFPKQLSDTGRIFSQGARREFESKEGEDGKKLFAEIQPLLWSLCPPTIAAVLWPTAFASALDFAGVYANCFLFGILPPVMAWRYRYHLSDQADVLSRNKQLVPGGKLPLILLFGISILLGIRPRI
ncbi:tyrosine-specific transport protein [Marchantia polymorpha subsp. ruderalis]|uniref:Amino acid transporter transmembrane domain-containing protein n=2 Tax=Marchantia polymorpha TaxID=3197 RepID=A0A176WMN3_MARPO|nr:hypothetical protein AXG93_2139s1050 [Marchantia polymorpha subsp. ruderalis]PTQ45908.1 hypothetical protein MARPO_0013s0120 [Marchantia polymorpha]PTQ45909.1 hypothetical protein MARPO_0013s0120 [Marchantia polymorpha]PTQ45910.1 hypothetical protein MARPO_0013s0120 [Marchantia polymorpha]BBN18936.1 hypothetical protein Mp_8g06720 [Marchantia polymorpha subsp. ruderalis]|eukprot:PTQ45908.1 hypothetical protein MARPO_0013s0120 [Marchantia polymorpha]